ncbi:DUF2996 domain-containing protein [Prochlorococcus marinus]|uniref:DUF2996 domain-containing protein n=1 Tax=Prochlorococcus marinus TaxID=1219 RepID=UPI0022B56423|nr:DUF2996 domain-containing protein [Prochlorococcus marinus]
MKNKNHSDEIDSNKLTESKSSDLKTQAIGNKIDTKGLAKPLSQPENQTDNTIPPKKAVKPPKLEDKPFEEFITKHFIPGLEASIQEKGIAVKNIKLIEGERPVVGGNCWMVFCEISQQRRFWLCFTKEIITSDKTILLAETNTNPSIVESFLIDEKKTTLPLLISRVLQRLNGQKWIGAN